MNSQCVLDMCKEKINNKSDFRKWALKNHPDKGGNAKLFKKINECVQTNNFCPEDLCSKEIMDEAELKIFQAKRMIKSFTRSIRTEKKRLKEGEIWIQKFLKSISLIKKDKNLTEEQKKEEIKQIYKDIEEIRNVEIPQTKKEVEETVKEYQRIINEGREMLKVNQNILRLCKKLKKQDEKLKKMQEKLKKKQIVLQIQEAPKKITKPRKQIERKPCKETHMRDPMTCKCIVDRTKKKCPANKTLNPLTGRCLSSYDPKKKC